MNNMLCRYKPYQRHFLVQTQLRVDIRIFFAKSPHRYLCRPPVVLSNTLQQVDSKPAEATVEIDHRVDAADAVAPLGEYANVLYDTLDVRERYGL